MAARSAAAADLIEQASLEFLGAWRRLVSSTNWEKGRIILDWRRGLMESGATAAGCSDDAWSRRVGGVSGQHVGRLRRVYERFGAVRESYPDLHWSHFQAALDWHDAEMWLEGAVQSEWSVSQMRAQRWEALGAPEGERPRDSDIITSEPDEDFIPFEDGPTSAGREKRSPRESDDEPRGDAKRSGTLELPPQSTTFDPDAVYLHDPDLGEPIRPFAELAELPDDLQEAFEAFKLSILRHKLSHWKEVARDDVLASLDALRALALAPSDDGR